MLRQITATKEFMVRGDLYIASIEMDGLYGMEAFEADVRITSLRRSDGEDIDEDDVSWISHNISESCRVTLYTHNDIKSDREFQDEALADELHRGN